MLFFINPMWAWEPQIIILNLGVFLGMQGEAEDETGMQMPRWGAGGGSSRVCLACLSSMSLTEA